MFAPSHLRYCDAGISVVVLDRYCEDFRRNQEEQWSERTPLTDPGYHVLRLLKLPVDNELFCSADVKFAD